MRKILFITYIIFVITGCGKDVERKLGDGYIYHYWDVNSNSITDCNNTILIDYKILEYEFDSTFIIVSQRPWDSIANIHKMTYKESNKAFNNSTFRQYWIINKKEKCIFSGDSIRKNTRYSNVYGPFKWDEYMKKRKELGVPKELKLKK